MSRWLASRVVWNASVPLAIVLVAVGVLIDSDVSFALYVAGVLVAGARVARFVVQDVAPQDPCAGQRLPPDVQPKVKTTSRAVRPY
jgi:hypothetical protein